MPTCPQEPRGVWAPGQRRQGLALGDTRPPPAQHQLTPPHTPHTPTALTHLTPHRQVRGQGAPALPSQRGSAGPEQASTLRSPPFPGGPHGSELRKGRGTGRFTPHPLPALHPCLTGQGMPAPHRHGSATWPAWLQEPWTTPRQALMAHLPTFTWQVMFNRHSQTS